MNHVYLAMHPTREHPFGASIPHLSLLELGVIELLWRGEDRPEMAGMKTLALSMIERERTERTTDAPSDAAVVLQVRDGDIDLLRSVRGIRVEIVNYDSVEDWLAADAMHADDPLPPVDATGVPYISSSPAVHCAACTDWIGDDEPRVSMGARHAALSYCLHCATSVPGLGAFAQDASHCEVAAHAPVIAGLRARGVEAFEEATGGNNYHVCYPHPSGGFILADTNLGCWSAGVYVKPSDGDEDDDGWRWSPAEMHDTDLPDDADPPLVVAWLLENVR